MNGRAPILRSFRAMILPAAVLGWALPLAAGVTVSHWLTSADQSQLLSLQAPLQFQPDSGSNPLTISLNEGQAYQVMEGYGASFTDSSAYVVYNELSPAQRDAAMMALFDPTNGIGVDLLRQPMGASDFSSAGNYSYDDMPPGQSDPTLAHFSIAHDQAYIIPLLKQALAINPALRIIGTPWSPPGWMKDSDSMIGGNFLPQYYAAYAQYFVKYIQAYQAQGLPIYAVTPQNEPLYSPTGYPGMYFPATQELEFVRNYLGPAFEAAGLATKILVYDHNWDQPAYPTTVLSDPVACFYSAGTAWHWYGGSPTAQQGVHSAFPDREQWVTEAASGTWNGSFAQNIVNDAENLIIGPARNWAQAGIKWTIALDTNNGPTNGGCSTCWGLITVDPASQTFSQGVGYEALGQASKFVQPGAWRIDSNTFGGGSIDDVAFQDPDGSDVLLAINTNASPQTFKVLLNGQSFSDTLPAGAFATYRWAGATVIPAPTATPVPVSSSVWRINAGGAAATDSAGHVWSADTAFVGGGLGGNPGTVAGTPDQALYSTERYGTSFLYNFQVPPGLYRLTLKFSENYWTLPGQRVFNVSVNGHPILQGFDILAQAGGNLTALDKVFDNVQPDAQGRILVQFGPAAVDNAKVDALEVVPMASPTVTRSPSPTNSPTPSASATASSSMTLSATGTPIASPTASPSATPSNTATASPSATATASANPSATTSSTATGTPGATTTVSPAPTASPTPSFSALTTLSPSPMPSASATATATVTTAAAVTTGATPSTTAGSTAMATMTPTVTPTTTATASPVGSESATVTLSLTPSATATTSPGASASATASPSRGVTGQEDGPLVIRGAEPVPNPDPTDWRVDLEGPADGLTLELYSVSMVRLRVLEAPGAPAGWQRLGLPTGWRQGLAPGLYYFRVLARRGAVCSRPRLGRVLLF